jgi:hypothetical protein
MTKNVVLTDAMWKTALRKWSPGKKHTGACVFCNKYRPGAARSWHAELPGHRCVISGCPLASHKSASAVCCNGLWLDWTYTRVSYYCNFEEGDPKAAAKVHDYIAKKYRAWQKRNA